MGSSYADAALNLISSRTDWQSRCRALVGAIRSEIISIPTAAGTEASLPAADAAACQPEKRGWGGRLQTQALDRVHLRDDKVGGLGPQL